MKVPQTWNLAKSTSPVITYLPPWRTILWIGSGAPAWNELDDAVRWWPGLGESGAGAVCSGTIVPLSPGVRPPPSTGVPGYSRPNSNPFSLFSCVFFIVIYYSAGDMGRAYFTQHVLNTD